MPAQQPDPPSRAEPSAATANGGPAEEEFFRAVSERPPPPASAPASSVGVDTTVDEVLFPAPAGVPASSAAGPTKREEGIAADGQPLIEADELVGTTLSQTYEIIRAVGEGGMGRVYEARHTRIASKRFAIKTLHPEYLRQADVRARFQREAETAATIEHPHVVGVVDVDRTRDGRPFLVTEFLDGEDLGDRIKKAGRLPVPGAVRIVRQVCKALMAAHSHEIVHRDIKPDNVFLTGPVTAPTAKVLDFGISRIASASGNSLTKTGMIMGTPSYMAPEQARGTKVDHRADIYSLGAVLYTAVTGKEPFELEDPSAILAAVLTRDPPRPCSIEPSIDENLEHIIQQAMAKEPDERFQDVSEMYTALAPYDPAETVEEASSPTANMDVRIGRSHIRPALGSSSAPLTQQSLRVKSARPQIVLGGIIGLLWTLALLGMAVSGILRLMRDGEGLSGLETALMLLAVTTTLVTPAALAIRHVKKKVWANTAKSLALGDTIRGPLVASMVAFGSFALALRVRETLLNHNPAGLAWPVWDLMLVAFAMAAAVGTHLVGRASVGSRGATAVDHAKRQQWLRAAVFSCGLLLAVASIWLAGSMRDGPAPIANAEPSSEVSATALATATAPPLAPRDRASTVDLAAAKGKGLAALQQLRKKYPKDTAVLKALLMAQAKEPKGLPKAIDLAEQLFRMAPNAAEDELVYRFMFKAANSTDAVATKALNLMAHKMGPKGPDLLWELWVGNGRKAVAAAKLLDSPKVRSRGTPALRIAVELRQAKGCTGKGKLLARAAEEGDERVVAILKPLSKGTRRGCGFLDLSPCAARCSAQAAEMKRTISAIQGRTK